MHLCTGIGIYEWINTENFAKQIQIDFITLEFLWIHRTLSKLDKKKSCILQISFSIWKQFRQLLSSCVRVLKASALPLSYSLFVANNSMGNLNAYYKSICIQQSTEAKPTTTAEHTKWPVERTFQKAIRSLHTHTHTQRQVNNKLGRASPFKSEI